VFEKSAHVPSEAEQLAEARNEKYVNAGRDVLLDALNNPIQARNANISRLPENQPDYFDNREPEVHYGESRELKLPRSNWIY
jgi:hypothetical protein